MTEMVRWLLVVVQIPTKPSRHRVAVWRELRRAGAVPITQGSWAVPDTEGFRQSVERAGELAAAGGGTLAVFDLGPRDAGSRAFVEDAFRAARTDEWSEFLADCGKFCAEIEREIAKRKFTFAELEEEEQSLDRLRRWHRELRKRDVLTLPEAQDALRLLRECERELDAYAERVYEATSGSSAVDR